MKLIKKMVIYKNKKGEEKKTYNFYILFDNGQKVAIKNSFENDYSKLCFVAEKEEK